MRDIQGNCVKKPCEGDPVINPEIAPQTNSGIRGGMFGYTRKDKNKNPLFHGGLDIKNPENAPIFAMYSGNAIVKDQKDKNGNLVGAGHYIEVHSEINGQNVVLMYFHMQNENRRSGSVNAGDIIGYQGDSGNLKNAINQGLAVSHVHIKAKINGQTVDPLSLLTTLIDSETGQVLNNCNE